MELRRPALLCLYFLCWQVAASAQSFGGNPSSIRWQQVNTPAAKIIFPRGYDSLAQRIAAVTYELNKKYAGTIGDLNRKVSVVLQTRNTISNAYVGLAPYRSEFYLTTPQNPFQLGSLNWADNLAIHEFRHVEQYSNFNHGLAKVFSVLLGEQGQAFANALTIPDWFFEGDAVWNETAFSRQGRGRLPDAFNGYKSLYLQHKQYSYMKLRNGSLVDYTPDYYDLGYLLVAYGREQYGDSIWRKISNDAARFKGVFYPLQKAVKRYTGQSFTTFKNNALAFYQQQWETETKDQPLSTVNWLTQTGKHTVNNYKYPYPADDGSVVALKSGYRQIPVFVKLDADGNEEKIATKDIANDDYFGYNNGRIIYITYKPDLRWGNRDYSVIRVLDVATKKTRTISSRSKYYSPDINNDGNKIVVVDATVGQACLLKLLNADGNILQSWTADSSLFYSHPKFLGNGDIIVAVRKKNGEMGWLKWQPVENKSEWITAPKNQLVGFPVIDHDSMYYTATTGHTDGLYVIDLASGTPPQLVANYPTGIYQGFQKGSEVTGSTFTADGYRLGNFSIFPKTNVPGKLLELYVPKTLAAKPDVTAIGSNEFEITKFSKTNRIFNFHSWQPEIDDPDYSVALLGENVLNTLYSKLSYTYNRNESSHRAAFSEIFGGWYLEPFVTASETWNRSVQLNTDTLLQYNQGNINAGVQLPLNLSVNKAYRHLTLSAAFNHEDIKWTGFAKDRYLNSGINYLNLRLVHTVQIQKARQQIYPRYAESFTADYRKSLGSDQAWQYLLSGYLYLPGLLNTHNLVLSVAYQRRDTLQNYIYSNSFPFSRGYNDVNFPKMLRLGANYHFPLVYPDWGFGNILYFQRLRLNAFYDYTIGTSLRTAKDYYFSTVGSEMYFDTKWWNQLPVTFGIRYSRLLHHEYRGATNPNQWEIVLPIGLLPR